MEHTKLSVKESAFLLVVSIIVAAILSVAIARARFERLPVRLELACTPITESQFDGMRVRKCWSNKFDSFVGELKNGSMVHCKKRKLETTGPDGDKSSVLKSNVQIGDFANDTILITHAPYLACVTHDVNRVLYGLIPKDELELDWLENFKWKSKIVVQQYFIVCSKIIFFFSNTFINVLGVFPPCPGRLSNVTFDMSNMDDVDLLTLIW